MLSLKNMSCHGWGQKYDFIALALKIIAILFLKHSLLNSNRCVSTASFLQMALTQMCV